ncbi:transposase family protein [Streptomyces sp. NPDC094438]|uniref:transposase family protein n=1 Tax=Streptomyces sp. NPDC094438 TaxID=3366061 RepID=UPI00381B2C3E
MPTALGRWACISPNVPRESLPDLPFYLAQVPEPRDPRGRVYPLDALLAAAACAVLADACSLVAIGEWITDAPSGDLRRVGFPIDPLTGLVIVPHCTTLRRILERIDGDALHGALSRYPQQRQRVGEPISPQEPRHPGVQ